MFLFLAIASLTTFSTPRTVFAGDMVINEGTVFSETMIKDGRRIETTKTYTSNGVVIHQKIYDTTSGELIREKTTTNPIKDNVKLVSPESPQPTKVDTKKIDEADQIKVEQEDIVVEEELDSMELEMAEETNSELLAQRAKERYGYTKVNRVSVQKTLDRSEIAIEATKTKKFLGLFEVDIPVNVLIDIETLDILDDDKSYGTRILEALSL